MEFDRTYAEKTGPQQLANHTDMDIVRDRTSWPAKTMRRTTPEERRHWAVTLGCHTGLSHWAVTQPLTGLNGGATSQSDGPHGLERLVEVGEVTALIPPLLRRYSAVTSPLLRLYSTSTSTPPLLRLYSASTSPPLRLYSAVTPPLLRLYSASTPPLLHLHFHSAATPPLLRLYFTSTPPLLRLYSTATMRHRSVALSAFLIGPLTSCRDIAETPGTEL